VIAFPDPVLGDLTLPPLECAFGCMIHVFADSRPGWRPGPKRSFADWLEKAARSLYRAARKLACAIRKL